MDERIAERRARVREQRMRGRRRRTARVLALAILVVAAIVVERSPLVELAEVRVEGTGRLEPEEVREAAALPLGTSIVRLPLREARANVEALALVREARLRRVDPLTVVITVVEREPALVLEADGSRWLVDETGIVLAAGEIPGLPVIAIGELSPPSVGASLDDVPAAANAYAIHVALPGPLRVEVERYEARGQDDADLVLAGGVRVRFGRAERVPEKARALGAILEDLGLHTVSAIDVRAPSNPAVVPDR